MARGPRCTAPPRPTSRRTAATTTRTHNVRSQARRRRHSSPASCGSARPTGWVRVAEVTATANRVERRLVLVVGAVVFVDTMFYAAIAPVLPGLAKELHLSKLSAGALT